MYFKVYLGGHDVDLSVSSNTHLILTLCFRDVSLDFGVSNKFGVEDLQCYCSPV